MLPKLRTNGTVGENNAADDGAIVSDPSHVYQKVQQPSGVNTDGQTVAITPVDLSGNLLYGQTPITIPGVAGYEVTVPEIPGYTAITDTTVPTNGENKVVYVPKADYGTVVKTTRRMMVQLSVIQVMYTKRYSNRAALIPMAKP
jgi:hypothetical protein